MSFISEKGFPFPQYLCFKEKKNANVRTCFFLSTKEVRSIIIIKKRKIFNRDAEGLEIQTATSSGSKFWLAFHCTGILCAECRGA